MRDAHARHGRRALAAQLQRCRVLRLHHSSSDNALGKGEPLFGHSTSASAIRAEQGSKFAVTASLQDMPPVQLQDKTGRTRTRASQTVQDRTLMQLQVPPTQDQAMLWAP